MSSNDRTRKLCRICGDVGSLNIFGTLGQTLDLSEKINTLLPINITLNDRLSTMICDACVSQITTINHIVEMSGRTNEIMTKILEKENNSFQERMLKLCRICGNPGLWDIYNQYGNSVSLADKINLIATLQVSPEDQLSLKICRNCIVQIEDVHPIFEFCHNTTKLMSIIAGDITQDIMKNETHSLGIENTLNEDFAMIDSLGIEKTVKEDFAIGINEIVIQENNNKENELYIFTVDEHNAKTSNITFTDKELDLKNKTNKTQCLRCTETFKSGTELRSHILLNHNLKELDCHHCFRRCSNVIEFENHVKLHFAAELPYYPCDLCLTCFNSLTDLIRHIKTHDVPRTREWALAFNLPDNCTYIGCRYCNKTFILETSRRIHERSHFTCLICETCGKQLPNKSQLSVHQRQHTGERPYKCIICDSSFKCLSTLRQHEVVHSPKKYSCEICLRKFSRPEKVRIHMRVHTGEKPYNCLMCHKKYQQKNDLNRHVKKKHEHYTATKNFR